MIFKTLIAASLCATTFFAHAQSANSPVTLVVPFAAGNALDVAARALATVASNSLKRSIIVENRPGASGAIAAASLVTNKERNAFLFGTTAMMTITPYIMKVTYSPNDFVPVAKATNISTIFSVPSSSSAKTWADFVSQAKANPGKCTYASTGQGTIIHLSLEILQAASDLKLLHVPYSNTSSAMQDFLGGRVDIYTEPAVIQHIQSGQVRGLAVLSDERLKELPDVPTMRELNVPYGYQPWLGVFASQFVDETLRKDMEKALQQAVSSEEFRSKLPPGLNAAYANSHDFSEQIRAEQTMYKKIVEELNLKTP